MTKEEKALAKAINDMTSICDKGKKEVRELFASIGYKTEEDRIPTIGEVWKHDSSNRLRTVQYRKNGDLGFFSLKGEYCGHMLNCKSYTFIESSFGAYLAQETGHSFDKWSE